MDKYYWNIETQEAEPLEIIMESYDREKSYMAFGDGSPEAYIECSMYWNNGALMSLRDRMQELQHNIDRKKTIGYKYGMELVDEELEELQTELSELNRLYLET